MAAGGARAEAAGAQAGAASAEAPRHADLYREAARRAINFVTAHSRVGWGRSEPTHLAGYAAGELIPVRDGHELYPVAAFERAYAYVDQAAAACLVEGHYDTHQAELWGVLLGYLDDVSSAEDTEDVVPAVTEGLRDFTY